MTERLIPTTSVLCLSAALFITATLHGAEWEELPKLPEPNGGFMCGAQRSFVVIVGGTNWEGGTKNWLRHIHHYDSRKRRWWSEVDAELTHPLAYGVVMKTRVSSGHDDFSIIGGSDGKRAVRKQWIVDGIKTGEGFPVRDLSSSVVLSAGGQIGDRKFIVGGTDDAANLAGFQKTAFEVSFVDKPWIDRRFQAAKIPDYPGKPFGTAASTVAVQELFIFGGANWDVATSTVVNASEAHAFSVKTNLWRKLKPLPAAVRGLSAVTLDDHRIYLAGGYKSDPEGFTADAWVYDVQTDSYSPAKPLPYAAMVGLVALDGFVYCMGGEDKMKHRTDMFFRVRADELSP